MVPKNFQDRQVCIVGLGYVGLTLGAVMADCGFEVFGIEIRDDIVAMLRKGEPHFHEPGLAEMLKRVLKQGTFHVAKHIPAGVPARVFFITVGTPLGSNGRVRLDYISNVAREVSEHLHENDMVILRSTVKLGATRGIAAPVLEKSGKSYNLAFCPERTVEGYALSELRQLPQIVGGIDLESTVRAAQLFQFITPSVVQVSDLETAEMIKLVSNAHRDVYLAYGNEVARMCDAVGVSTAEVIQLGQLGYPRVNIYMPGPVGGPCLEKDPHILAEGLEKFDIVPEISRAARLVNERQPKEIVSFIAKTVKRLPGFSKNPIIALLGIAFKGRPETDDLRGTMARPIFEEMKKYFPNAEFRGFDPVVSEKAIRDFGLLPCKKLEDVFDHANIVCILNNHPLFGKMNLEGLTDGLKRPALVYDFWSNFSGRELSLPDGIAYMALGSHGSAILPSNYDKEISRDRRHRFHRIRTRQEARKQRHIRTRA